MNKWIDIAVDHQLEETCKSLVPRIGDHGSVGMHVLLELYQCDPSTMSVIGAVQSEFEAAARAAQCTIVTSAFHAFEPHGVSGVVVISESHFTYHGWDEHQYAAIDLFYCGDHVQIELAIRHLVDYFQAKRLCLKVFPRGGFECHECV